MSPRQPILLFLAGVVYTENSCYTQAVHIDFDEMEKPAVDKSWILHLPLQKEGLPLSVWNLLDLLY